MDPRIKRFKLCDLKFQPHLSNVIERLPKSVREAVLEDSSFQILTDEDAPKACVLRYRFSEPVKALVYLNTNLLKAPEHQLIYAIAAEIAHYILSKKSTDFGTAEKEALLHEWGFEKEVAAARTSSKVCESRGYRIGYEWAKKQDPDYLQQHFGLYFDAWNQKGLDTLSGETPGGEKHQAHPGHILQDIIRLKQGESPDACRDKFSETPSLKQEVLIGIMAAMKESAPTRPRVSQRPPAEQVA
ncbi:MAG: hypothetical protein JSW26_07305 [Desulfobacterales bacterium]|nr:MAG: hypothetical protein JSW26_07305 [Desulfobacterales bacterium]